MWKPGGATDTAHFSSLYPERLFHRVDTEGGQSGAGVYHILNGARQVNAIHTGFYDTWPNSYDDNQGRDISSGVFNWITSYWL
jgi:V8-like Glu-specific endopeptidase